MNARQLRLVRAAAIAAIATVIAAISHTFGGGSAPHPLLILAVAALLTPLSTVLVGVRHSRGRAAATVILAQTAFHLLFQALGSPTGATATGAVGHAHHVDLALLGPVSSAAAPGTIMVVAHAVAAVLTTVLVWHGETLVRIVAGWIEALFRDVGAAVPAEHRRPPGLRSSTTASFDAAISAAVPRRGPPLLIRD